MTPMKIICQLLLFLSAVTAECPAGYEDVDSKCIHRFNGGYLTYDAAVDYCRQHFGRLPVIDDCSTFTEVATFVDDGYSAEANKGFWLGATYSTRDGVWRWSDGAAVPMGAPYWAFVSDFAIQNNPP
ncbi:C-type lectin domain family 17, member A-like [Hyalella azteca]|uniref:C-type lectin domain family 17, member A-like n=1 Tax=Hyalella azteca TaxID=294128 RepID=A0A8B7NX01_HYAAZ|nr:C-type lectin domain family 17, member A-like [Hyalella azteca]